MASFIATTNDRQPLTDPTGSRRYICCDIDGIIDTDTPIDHRQLYAQAVAELQRHVGKTDLPSVKLLTMALKSCGFPYGSIGGRRGWYARRKS